MNAGFLVGYNQGEIVRCYADGPVTLIQSGTASGKLETYVGGLIGRNVGGVLNECRATGAVSAITSGEEMSIYTGGLIGYTNASLLNSYATGSVNAATFASSTRNACVYTGGLIGYADGTANITSCYAVGSVTSSSTSANSSALAYTGGLIGYNRAGLSKCHAVGLVSATATFTGNVSDAFAYAGGLVGWNRADLTECYATGSVNAVASSSAASITEFSAYAYAGGLVGDHLFNSLSQCYATGDVNGEAVGLQSLACTGALVGRNYASPIIQSYSSSSVTGRGSTVRAGGLAGFQEFLQARLTNCYASGPVRGLGWDEACVGGLLGSNQNGTVGFCHAVGPIDRRFVRFVGGLLGCNWGEPSTEPIGIRIERVYRFPPEALE